jgi:alpha-glucosidase (family GH31 glycosyl hydrolase)
VCDPDDIVFFMRSGNGKSPGSTPLFWVGDQTVTWDSHDGLGTVIIAMLTEGLSGYSLTHSDIGGYTAIDFFPLHYIRSKSLLMRWCELAAFATMYRSHLGTLPTKNWQIYDDTETLAHFFNMSLVFRSWDFYRRELMKEAETYGWPVARHMILVYPNNSGVYSEDLRYQFMLGTQLLVAPVHERFDILEERRVFLPEGITWVHIWTGKAYRGANSWVLIKAPLGQPPVFYPQGSAVGQQFVQNLKQRNLL